MATKALLDWSPSKVASAKIGELLSRVNTGSYVHPIATKGTRTRRQKRIQPREEQPLPLMTTTNTTTRMLRTKRLILSPCTKNKKPWTANVQKNFVSPQLQNKIELEQIHKSRHSPDENAIQQSHILVTLNFEAVPL